MELKRGFTKDASGKLFTLLLAIMLVFVLTVLGLLFWLSFKGSAIFYQLIILSSMIMLIMFSIATGLTIYAIIMLWKKKRIPFFIKRVMESFIGFSYPLIMILGTTLKHDKNTIRRAYTDLNNRLILSGVYDFKGEDILILTPHCIQKSSCPHKITNDIYNCKRCGGCDVDELMVLKEKYHLHFHLVTGGTLARKTIMDLRPKAVIAIACERDLFSGLMDVKKIPILAIINKRPQGPCINTQVDITEVEEAILHFIKE